MHYYIWIIIFRNKFYLITHLECNISPLNFNTFIDTYYILYYFVLDICMIFDQNCLMHNINILICFIFKCIYNDKKKTSHVTHVKIVTLLSLYLKHFRD